MTAMAKIYARRVEDGAKDFNQINNKYKNDVKEVLAEDALAYRYGMSPERYEEITGEHLDVPEPEEPETPEE